MHLSNKSIILQKNIVQPYEEFKTTSKVEFKKHIILITKCCDLFFLANRKKKLNTFCSFNSEEKKIIIKEQSSKMRNFSNHLDQYRRNYGEFN